MSSYFARRLTYDEPEYYGGGGGRYRPGATLADLLMRQGDLGAERARAVAPLASAIQDAGEAIGEGIQKWEMSKRNKGWVDYVESGEWTKDPKAAYARAQKVWGPQEGRLQFEALAATQRIGQGNPEQDRKDLGLIIGAADQMDDGARAHLWPQLRAIGRRVFPHVEIGEQYDPQQWAAISPLGPQLRGEKPEKLGRGDRLVQGNRVVVDALPETEKPDTRSLDVQAAEALRRGDKATYGQILKVKKEMGQADDRQPRGGGDGEPLMAVIGDDGQPVYLPRSQAVGRRPASSREQGRPVVSGDANRIADFDTSLDDLNDLTGAIGRKGATGASAKVGAAVPNFVTEWTGFGADAKKKQAVIDRVKQVIGKALEGGVLRKEDEYKYEKILPTIGDPPDLVQTKMTGLYGAIQQRRQTLLDSLSDAGYDVAKYSARAPRERSRAGSAGGGGPVRIGSDSDYDALPSGAEFVGPDGKRRRKP